MDSTQLSYSRWPPQRSTWDQHTPCRLPSASTPRATSATPGQKALPTPQALTSTKCWWLKGGTPPGGTTPLPSWPMASLLPRFVNQGLFYPATAEPHTIVQWYIHAQPGSCPGYGRTRAELCIMHHSVVMSARTVKRGPFQFFHFPIFLISCCLHSVSLNSHIVMTL